MAHPLVVAVKVAGGAIVGVGSVLAKNIPRLEDEVVVEVVGQPGASKKRLYFLALAAANGIVRRFTDILSTPANAVAPPMQMLMIEYDAADHWVRCTLRYNVSASKAAARSGPRKGKFFEAVAVYAGPECDVVGGEFSFVSGTILAGLPASSDPKDGAPFLEFEGRTILTPCPTVPDPKPGVGEPSKTIIPSPNPKPVGDNRSRGAVVRPKDGGSGSSGSGLVDSIRAGVYSSSPSYDPCCSKSLELVPLVFAALSDPGSFADEIWETPKQGPLGG